MRKRQLGGLQPIPLDTIYDPQTPDSTLQLLDPLASFLDQADTTGDYESMNAMNRANTQYNQMKRAIVSDLDKMKREPKKFRYRERKMGGYYQDGGLNLDPEPAPVQQVTFDSTDDYEPAQDLSYDDDLDELPMDDDGIDLAAFKPNLGNDSHKAAPLNRQVSLLIDMLGVKPSSTNTGNHNKNSLHYSGNAFDVGLNTSFGGSTQKMREFKDKFLEMQRTNPLYAQFELVDETTRPKGQEVWSGAHYHIQLKR